MTPQQLEALVTALRTPMLRFAQRLIHPREAAEDAVQEALLALAESSQALSQAVDPRRYVFGILKNKVTDALRRHYRQAQTFFQETAQGIDDELFDALGHWLPDTAPALWNTPESQLQSDQFFAVVDACVHQLSEKIAKVFSMKTFLEFEAEEVCAVLQMSKADYWQCLSRARKQLQLCLDQRWFQEARP
jgi:RNA polymerase sigma-70 factor (ECF subfamily)